MSGLGQDFLPNLRYLKPDVVMLCANDGWDVRALKEARSLAASGLSVVIVGRRRYHTDLARFSDEFEIDIVDVAMLNDPVTMRLHMESGVWKRMSLFEKILTSFLHWWFSMTGLKIKPKFVPPPVSGNVLKKIERRRNLLAARAKKRGKRKKLAPRGHSLWRESLARTYARATAPLALRLQKNRITFLFMRALALFAKGIILLLILPFAFIALPFILIYKGVRWLHAKVRRFIPEPPNLLGRIHRRILAEITKSGRTMFRYSRFFLYTLEYGETVARLNPKIIHAHDLYTLQAATRIAKWTGAKVIYDAHELESDRRAGTGKRMKKWIINQEKKYAPKADGWVTVSHAIGDEMVKECKLKDQPTVVFNSPVIKGMPKAMTGRTVRTDLGLDSSVPLFVFVGKVYEIHKGNQKIAYIIDAIADIEDFHLAIVGPMSDHAREQIRSLLEENNAKGRVHLVPPIPAEAIVHYIKDADASVYFMWPDTRNIDLTIPNKLFEFSLSGLPLVVSSLYSTRWFCEQFDNAIPVAENTKEAITAACRQAYAERDRLRPTSEQLEIMKRDFSWSAQADKLWALYRSILLLPDGRLKK